MVSRYAVAAALLAGVAQAGPVDVRSADMIRRTPSPAAFSCAREWTDETLFRGRRPALVSRDGGLSPPTGVDLGLSLPRAVINGDINLGLTDRFLLSPSITVDLSGLEVYVELAVSAGAAVYESLELLASARLDLAVPGLVETSVRAGLALDLIVGVSAAVDLEAGFHLTFPEGCVVEVSVLTKEVVAGTLDGVIAKTLPVGLGPGVDLSAEIELNLGLRLRCEVGLQAGLDVAGLDIGAGAEVAIWVNLFDYTQLLVGTPGCALSVTESFELDVGVAVALDVDVDHLLDLALAPTASVVVAAGPTKVACLATVPACARCGGASSSAHVTGQPDLPTKSEAGGEGSRPSPTGRPILPGKPGPGRGIHASSSSSSAAAAAAEATSPAAAEVTSPTTIPAGTPAGSDLVPTTIYGTSTYTVTQCAATVANCPAEYTQVTTSEVQSTVTVCPAGETSKTALPSQQAPPEAVSSPAVGSADAVRPKVSSSPAGFPARPVFQQSSSSRVSVPTPVVPSPQAAAPSSGSGSSSSSSNSFNVAAAPPAAPAAAVPTASLISAAPRPCTTCTTPAVMASAVKVGSGAAAGLVAMVGAVAFALL